jgi:hypothetical protein
MVDLQRDTEDELDWKTEMNILLPVLKFDDWKRK